MIVEANAGYRMEEEGSGRVVVQFGDIIKVFHIYVIYARKGFAARVRRRCAPSWRLVRQHRLYARASGGDDRHRAPQAPRSLSRSRRRDYDELIGMFNRTGRFNPAALAVLSRSFVEMGMLAQEPDIKTLITERIPAGGEVRMRSNRMHSAPLSPLRGRGLG